jgi:pimeloyl-ACP methyl ester carboxylesterase
LKPGRSLGSTGRPVVSVDAGVGPPMLVLHGLAGSARWWERNVPALAGSNRVLVIDLPAFGDAAGSRFELRRIPDQLVATMDRLGIERTSLVGHSMGGLIAARLAAEHPERFDRLVLVDAGFLSLDPNMLHRLLGPIQAVRWLRPGLARRLVDDVARAGPVDLVRATIQLLRADWTSDLDRIAAPTLVVWGEHDTICPPVIGRRIVERISGSRLMTIPDCGHNPMWEQSAAFDRVVLDFLAEAWTDQVGPPGRE